ncbi:MAG: S41 family peptidase [Clostridia bacterium]|nr:S41 family peptidase [Clostridia bacterium]
MERVDEIDEEKNKIEVAHAKGFLKGILYGALIIALLFLLPRFSYLSHQLENINTVDKKLNEINYFVNKYFLYDKDLKNIEDYIAMGMMAGLDDKYAAYYNEEELEKFNETANGEYVGIGVIVVKDSKDGLLTVTKIYDNSPAKQTKLAVGDKILYVDGEDVTSYDTDEVVSLVKGEEGTNVKISVLKANGYDVEEYEITRQKIETEIVTGEMLDNELAYVYIDQFDGKAFDQMVQFENQFIEQKAKGLIIDLRNNPGGSLGQLISISNIFLDDKLITYFQYKNGERQDYYTGKGMWDIPVVILVNEYSASAAEAFTGALKDNGRATVVGKTTFGKGIVQDMFSLSDGTAIKFTVADYYTPSDVNITGKGITPDYEVENDNQYVDKQLEKAKEVLRDIIKNK